MNELEIDTKAVDGKSMTALEKSKALLIASNGDFSGADTFCTALKGIEKEIIETFADPKKKALAAHRSIVAAEGRHLEPILEARVIIKKKMGTWQDEQEAIRREEEKCLQVIAQKKADDEALAAAALAQQAGDTEQAEAIIAAPVAAPAVYVPKETPKAKTVLTRPWKFRIVSAGIVPREYLIPDEKQIGARGRSSFGKAVISGVEFYQE